MKLGGAVLTVLLVVVWIGSGVPRVREHMYCVPSPGLSVSALFGRLTFTSLSGRTVWFSSLGQWTTSLGEWTISWVPHWESRPSGWSLDIPLWPLIVGLAWAMISVWRRDTRARRDLVNLCPKCNYDRTGLAPGAVCPECGSAPS